MKNLLTLLVCICCVKFADARTPNIVLILTDDQGWSQLSESMDPKIPDASSRYLETPNMVRLVRSGMRFSNGYSPAPLCTPTRRSILCGTSAARSGTEFKSDWVPKDHATIPMMLKAVDANFKCAHFGKWGEQMISTPEECGYDLSDGMTGNATGGMPNSLGVKGGHNDGPAHFIDNVDPKRTKTLSSHATKFMSQNAATETPFYMQVSFYAQHLSVVTSEDMLAKYMAKGTPDRGYTEAWAAMMEELDTGVGQILSCIEDLGISDNTYFVFTSDNGGRGTVPGGDNSRADTNAPLTGAKHSLYEGGVRVPFVIRGPGVAENSICRVPVVGYDFLPTFVDLVGGDPSRLPTEVDGVSIKPLLLGGNSLGSRRPSDAIVFHRPERLFSAIRTNDHKLMLYWKRNGEIDRHELYDLSTTPTETGNDIATEQPAVATDLQQRLSEFLVFVDADKPSASKIKKTKRQKKQ